MNKEEIVNVIKGKISARDLETVSELSATIKSLLETIDPVRNAFNQEEFINHPLSEIYNELERSHQALSLADCHLFRAKELIG
jgi:hypothetical protein